jgi:hypothetical protein
MSLGSFLSKLWASIKSLFDKLPAELQLAAKAGVVIVQSIKTAVDSPIVGILTAIIPGDLDDRIIAWLRSALPKALADLKLVEATAGLTDPDEIVAAGIKAIQALDPDIQPAFLHSLGVLIAQEVAAAQDRKLTWSDAVMVIEWYYQNKVKATA